MINKTLHLEFQAQEGRYFSITQYNGWTTVIDLDSLTMEECTQFEAAIIERKEQIRSEELQLPEDCPDSIKPSVS